MPNATDSVRERRAKESAVARSSRRRSNAGTAATRKAPSPPIQASFARRCKKFTGTEHDLQQQPAEQQALSDDLEPESRRFRHHGTVGNAESIARRTRYSARGAHGESEGATAEMSVVGGYHLPRRRVRSTAARRKRH